MCSIKKYYDSKGVLYSYLIPSSYSSNGIEFISDDKDNFQVANMSHKKGHIIQNHYHNLNTRIIDYTSEVLVVKKGKIKVTLFENKEKLCQFMIGDGDILVLLAGGHGFEMVEDSEFVEIKQGPFVGDKDKTRF